MEDLNKFKPYISHLDRQLKELKPILESLNSKSLDEQLLLQSDERARLDLTNKYAYMLSSLMFAYMKVLNVSNMDPVMEELSRVKSYMDQARRLDISQKQKDQENKKEQQNAKGLMRNVLAPSISKLNFEGKHTKFEDQDESQDEAREASQEAAQEAAQELVRKEWRKSSGNINKNASGRSQGKSSRSKGFKSNKSKVRVSKPKSRGGSKSTKPSISGKAAGGVDTSNR